MLEALSNVLYEDWKVLFSLAFLWIYAFLTHFAGCRPLGEGSDLVGTWGAIVNELHNILSNQH